MPRSRSSQSTANNAELDFALCSASGRHVDPGASRNRVFRLSCGSPHPDTPRRGPSRPWRGDMHDRDLHANILGVSAPWQFSDVVLEVVLEVVLDIAAGTVEAFVEHHGEASCPKCGKLCGDGDALGGARLAVHRVPRGGRDRLTERGGGVDERADPTDQADGVRVPEPRALPERDHLPSRRAGPPSEAGLSPHDLLKRRNSVVRKVQHGI